MRVDVLSRSLVRADWTSKKYVVTLSPATFGIISIWTLRSQRPPSDTNELVVVFNCFPSVVSGRYASSFPVPIQSSYFGWWLSVKNVTQLGGQWPQAVLTGWIPVHCLSSGC